MKQKISSSTKQPYLKGTCHGESLGCLNIGRGLLTLLITLLVCGAAPYWFQIRSYNQWQNLNGLQESHQSVMGRITGKEIVQVKNSGPNHWVYYSYQIKPTYGMTQTFNQRELVDKPYYDRTPAPPAPIEVLYATRNPAVAQIANRFSNNVVQEAWGSYIALRLAQLIGGLTVVGVMGLGLYQWWLTDQLNQAGKIIMAEVSAMDCQKQYGKGNQITHDYYVSYRYLNYETRFKASENGFKQLRVGRPIKICYLLHKPHISRPHPLDKYYMS